MTPTTISPEHPTMPAPRPGEVEPDRLAARSLFADLPAPELEELAAALRVIRADAGTNVVTVDELGTTVYFVDEGEAEVLTAAPAPPGVLGPGDAFGEVGLLLTGERTATVVARTPMRLLSLSGWDFDRIRARVPELERSLRELALERALD
jgi:CRP/FNR family transcriptional regulator, cyclic AMP receptor protein